MIDLHYWTTPNGHKITIFLEETGLEYRVLPVNIAKGDQFKPEFLERRGVLSAAVVASALSRSIPARTASAVRVSPSAVSMAWAASIVVVSRAAPPGAVSVPMTVRISFGMPLRLVVNVASLYREFGATEPLNVLQLFGEMGRFHAELKGRATVHDHGHQHAQ